MQRENVFIRYGDILKLKIKKINKMNHNTGNKIFPNENYGQKPFKQTASIYFYLYCSVQVNLVEFYLKS